uniref:TROVE domain-containing protein n=1 Tax=Aureoumbra lagunensis TaxID=44058 RepID=A0A7S3JUV8_9STRA|mmetsp:Transcript_11412/g.15593  ORF Transcript_11412/g.15593 Transcript_11412/m.15593 type:complete len:630 (+) Transcript_11412:166-2055(+)
MAFVQAMDDSTVEKMMLGENGSPEYTAAGVGDARVALFAGCVRNSYNLDSLYNSVIDLAKRTNDINVWVDLMTLIFHTRDCRGGKGERELFYRLFFLLYREFPKITLELLEKIPEYGYWKDLVNIWDQVELQPSAVRENAESIRTAIVKLMAKQLLLDSVNDDLKKLSLCAKYAPRENKKFSKLAKALAHEIYPNDTNHRQKYRQLIVSLNTKLSTTEIKMCGKRWREISISSVPSLCLAKTRKAFLNEKLKRQKPLTGELAVTGDRYPDDEDRVECRQNLRDAVIKKKSIKGSQLFPHQLVHTIIKQHRSTSTLEDDVMNAQWQNLIASVRESFAQVNDSDIANEKKIDLGNLVALVDVSGSMYGQPLEVAIAMGLVVAELAAPAFQNRVLTFESTPRWHRIESHHNLPEKVRALMRMPWGGSTNFAAALEMILESSIKHKLKSDQIPDLIVFSDMQFDSANHGQGKWETHYERLVRRFAQAGIAAHGEPWQVPTITFWNLRATRHGAAYMAESDRIGVRLLSGFSTSLLKLLLDGSSLEEESEIEVVDDQGNVTTTKTNGPTPYSTMRKAIDDSRYDPIRLVLAVSQEEPFKTYHFQPTQQNNDADNDLIFVENDIDEISTSTNNLS